MLLGLFVLEGRLLELCGATWELVDSTAELVVTSVVLPGRLGFGFAEDEDISTELDELTSVLALDDDGGTTEDDEEEVF